METNIKKGLFIFLFIVLLLPFTEQSLSLVKSGPLHGGFRNASDTAFTVEKWIDGSYQHSKELYLNDMTGFRPDMVRLNNQIVFSFFDKCHAGWTIKGLDGYLFQRPYVDAYFGLDFQGYDVARKRAIKLKAIQDTLHNLGKSLILVYAASKATYFPEYFPRDRARDHRGMTNAQAYKHLGDSLGINQIDMDEWFLSMKNTTKELLFARQGIHWTAYGAIMAADSLIRYIEKMRNIQLEHTYWSKVERTDEPRYGSGDDDVASELNLIFPVARETFAYPSEEVVPDSTRKKLNAIFIGDSFAFKMLLASAIPRLSAHSEYWGYFDDVHWLNSDFFAYIRDYDWKAAIGKTDCLVLEYTSFNLAQLGNGFIEAAYDFYYPGKN